MAGATEGSLVDQIMEHIRQHSAWKARMLEAIQTGRWPGLVSEVSVDNKCAFGRWLGDFAADFQDDPHYQDVKRLHAAFHVQAAKTLSDGLAGRRDEAIRDVENGAFSKASSALVLAMSRWRLTL
ncbi:MAG: hypothetical protein GC160_28970 [Acidobacteria bacterium]|nr:hypothetical protein [Acidobacteriota bacterium]